MDPDEFEEESPRAVEAKPKRPAKRGPVVGTKLTKDEKEFVRANYSRYSDKQLAERMGRTEPSVRAARLRLGLGKNASEKKARIAAGSRSAYMSSLNEEGKKKFLIRELKESALFKTFCKAYEESQDYINLYKQKYVDFMMDPTIETMTSMEKDMLHEMILAQVREMEYLRKEKEPLTDANGEEYKVSFAKEIQACQEVIMKCQQSLNTERKQRLKEGNDQSLTFAQVMKELRNPRSRKVVGENAAMLKYIAERHYNDHLGKNIISGSDAKFDLGSLFKDGKEPGGLDGNFTPAPPAEASEEGQQAAAQKSGNGEALFAD